MDKKEELKQLEQELQLMEVKECEVYSRITGYYRPTKQFNPGKQSEYTERKVYDSAKNQLN